ncbi:MAG: exodeoxyribonuclease VII small subunit [Phycisphaera sp.]|nr:MAG: exodeoxyribonuclease VII small subunit [Phycisphaera sp.]
MTKKDKGKSVKASFEAQMEELEALIEQIEAGEIGLEESIKAYERGVDLIKSCRGVLGQAEQRVEELSKKLQDDSSGDDDA